MASRSHVALVTRRIQERLVADGVAPSVAAARAVLGLNRERVVRRQFAELVSQGVDPSDRIHLPALQGSAAE